jgi:hypothetical protein
MRFCLSAMARHFVPLEEETRRKGTGANAYRISAANFLVKVKSDEAWQKYSKALRFKEENASLLKYKKMCLEIEVTVK